jgi:hypothetical protein
MGDGERLLASVTNTLGTEGPVESPVQGKYSAHSDAHASERIRRVVPTKDHDGNADCRDDCPREYS